MINRFEELRLALVWTETDELGAPRLGTPLTVGHLDIHDPMCSKSECLSNPLNIFKSPSTSEAKYLTHIQQNHLQVHTPSFAYLQYPPAVCPERFAATASPHTPVKD